jgi:3-hydroxyisobutyrate dehydrogenase
VSAIQRILVIGVGQMGSGMAARCIDAGFDVLAIDLDLSKKPFFESNWLSPNELSALIATNIIVIVCVVDATQAREVLFEPSAKPAEFHHGLAHRLAAGSVVLMTPTIGVADMQNIGQQLESMGHACVDAPVSGGPLRARDGSMSIMLAGRPSVLQAMEPLVRTLSAHPTILGEQLGLATTAKLMNNALATVHLYNQAMALGAGERLGLSAQLLHQVIANSSGQSWIANQRTERYLQGESAVQARIALLAKDSALALATLRAQCLPTQWLEPGAAAFAQACEQGWADRDDSEILRFVAQRLP